MTALLRGVGVIVIVAAVRGLLVEVVPHDDILHDDVPHALIRVPGGIAFLLHRRW